MIITRTLLISDHELRTLFFSDIQFMASQMVCKFVELTFNILGLLYILKINAAKKQSVLQLRLRNYPRDNKWAKKAIPA